jgi:hypothetical protein
MGSVSGKLRAPLGAINPQQVLGFVQIVQVIGNINWKGYKTMWLGIASFFGGLFGKAKSAVTDPALKEYWGRLVLIILAAIIVGFVVYDWRRQTVEKTEARAALAVAEAELQTLKIKSAADEAARTARAEVLMELAQKNEEAVAELKTAGEANPEWSNQPLPKELRDALRNR